MPSRRSPATKATGATDHGADVSTAAVVGGAFVSGIGLGVYQVWRRARGPQPFGPEDVAFGIVLGSAVALPLAASHGVSALASSWAFPEPSKLPAFALLSMLIYLLALNRADQVVQMADGPRAAAYYLRDELGLFVMSLAVALAWASLR